MPAGYQSARSTMHRGSCSRLAGSASVRCLREIDPKGRIGLRSEVYIPATEVGNMADNRYYGVRVEGAKYGVGFGSALAIAISYTANHSILWAIIHGILGWLYVVYYALFRS